MCCCVFASDTSSFKCTSIYRGNEPRTLQSYAILSHQSHLTKVWNLCMNAMVSNLASYISAPSYTISLLFERKMQPTINAWDFVWQFVSTNCFGRLSHVHVGPHTMFTNSYHYSIRVIFYYDNAPFWKQHLWDLIHNYDTIFHSSCRS